MGKLLFFLENIGELCFFVLREEKGREPLQHTPTQNQFNLQKARKTSREDLPSSKPGFMLSMKKISGITNKHDILYTVHPNYRIKFEKN